MEHNIIKLQRRSPFNVSLLLPFDYTCYKNLLSFLMFFLFVFQTFHLSHRDFVAREGIMFAGGIQSDVRDEVEVEVDSNIEFFY